MLAEVFRLREDADVAGDLVVDDQRQVGLDAELGLELGDQLRVRREGEVFRHVERRGLELGRESIALLQGVELERVDRRDEALELIRQRPFGFQVKAAREHGVDREVEVQTRGLQAVGAIVGDARVIARLGARDELLRLLCGLVGGLLRGLRAGLRAGLRLHGPRRRRCSGGALVRLGLVRLGLGHRGRGLFRRRLGRRTRSACQWIAAGAAGQQKQRRREQGKRDAAEKFRIDHQSVRNGRAMEQRRNVSL